MDDYLKDKNQLFLKKNLFSPKASSTLFRSKRISKNVDFSLAANSTASQNFNYFSDFSPLWHILKFVDQGLSSSVPLFMAEMAEQLWETLKNLTLKKVE